MASEQNTAPPMPFSSWEGYKTFKKLMETNSFMLLFDWERAFDKVDQGLLINGLWRLNIPEKLFNIIFLFTNYFNSESKHRTIFGIQATTGRHPTKMSTVALPICFANDHAVPRHIWGSQSQNPGKWEGTVLCRRYYGCGQQSARNQHYPGTNLQAAASAAELQNSIYITRYGRFSERSIFCIIRLLGGFGMVRNTPTECGNHLPMLLRRYIFRYNWEVWTIFFQAYFRLFPESGNDYHKFS